MFPGTTAIKPRRVLVTRCIPCSMPCFSLQTIRTLTIGTQHCFLLNQKQQQQQQRQQQTFHFNRFNNYNTNEPNRCNYYSPNKILVRSMGHSVRIIVLSEIPNGKGYKGDVIDVKAGYARNYLIPQKMAVYATRQNFERYNVIDPKLLLLTSSNGSNESNRKNNNLFTNNKKEEVDEDLKASDLLKYYLRNKVLKIWRNVDSTNASSDFISPGIVDGKTLRDKLSKQLKIDLQSNESVQLIRSQPLSDDKISHAELSEEELEEMIQSYFASTSTSSTTTTTNTNTNTNTNTLATTTNTTNTINTDNDTTTTTTSAVATANDTPPAMPTLSEGKEDNSILDRDDSNGNKNAAVANDTEEDVTVLEKAVNDDVVAYDDIEDNVVVNDDVEEEEEEEEMDDTSNIVASEDKSNEKEDDETMTNSSTLTTTTTTTSESQSESTNKEKKKKKTKKIIVAQPEYIARRLGEYVACISLRGGYKIPLKVEVVKR